MALVDQCVEVLKEEGDDESAFRRGIEKVRKYLHPKNWKLKHVDLPVVDRDGMSDEWG